MSDDTYQLYRRSLRLCPYGLKYFCDGRVNKSQLEPGEELNDKSPCALRNCCPVANNIKKRRTD